MIQFASPTFLFRAACPTALRDIMQKIAAIGFDGLELYGMFGFQSNEISHFCREFGLKITCDHIHYEEFSQQTRDVIASRAAIGAKFLTIDNIPSDMIPGTSGFPRALPEIERIAKACKKSGIQLLYHNHGYDLITRVDGVPMLDIILDSTDPELLKFQPDLGWLSLGGGEPAEYLRKYGARCPIIHLKDYYASKPMLLESPFLLGEKRGGEEYGHFEFRPSGYGVMNFPAVMPLVLACNPEWITIDHDMSYERDNFEDMQMGLDYIRNLVSLCQYDTKP